MIAELFKNFKQTVKFTRTEIPRPLTLAEITYIYWISYSIVERDQFSRIHTNSSHKKTLDENQRHIRATGNILINKQFYF